MTAAVPRFEPMSVGAHLDRAFRWDNIWLILGITLVVFLPFHLLTVAPESALGFKVETANALRLGLYIGGCILLWASISFSLSAGAASYVIPRIGKDGFHLDMLSRSFAGKSGRN